MKAGGKVFQICSFKKCVGYSDFLHFPYTWQHQAVNLYAPSLKNSPLEGFFLKVGVAKQMKVLHIDWHKPVTYKDLEVTQFGRNLLCPLVGGEEVGGGAGGISVKGQALLEVYAFQH